MELLIDLQYFGNINYYSTLIKSTHVNFDLYVPWQKQGFLNRCTLSSANGPLRLSIPVVGGRDQKSPFRDVRICYREDWRSNHFKSIVSAYNRSPFFDHYKDSLEQLYLNKEEYIWKWNIRCLEWSLESLKLILNKNILVDSPSDTNSDFLLDFRGRFKPSDPRAGLDHTITYPQVFEERHGFFPDLSILDLIFCMGPSAAGVLKRS